MHIYAHIIIIMVYIHILSPWSTRFLRHTAPRGVWILDSLIIYTTKNIFLDNKVRYSKHFLNEPNFQTTNHISKQIMNIIGKIIWSNEKLYFRNKYLILRKMIFPTKNHIFPNKACFMGFLRVLRLALVGRPSSP